MKRVFLVIPNLEIGGAERLVIDLAAHLDKRIYEVSIVCLYDKLSAEYPTNKLNKVEIIRMGKKKGLDIGLIFKLIKLFLKKKPDVVHTHLFCALYTALPSIIARTKTRLHTVHSMARKELPRAKRLVMHVLYHVFGYRAVAISDQIRNDVSSYYRIALDSVKLVPNGIDIRKFSDKKKQGTREKLLKLISIGRLDSNKNHLLILKAFTLALKANPKVNIKLEIVGQGLQMAELKGYIERSDASDHISMLGLRSDIPELLKNADIYINTSIIEGLPLTILEAMASGLPIIATPAGGTIDIVKDGLNGIITSYDSRTVMEAILGLVNNGEARISMGIESRKIAKRFDIRIMTKAYENIYG